MKEKSGGAVGGGGVIVKLMVTLRKQRFGGTPGEHGAKDQRQVGAGVLNGRFRREHQEGAGDGEEQGNDGNGKVGVDVFLGRFLLMTSLYIVGWTVYFFLVST